MNTLQLLHRPAAIARPCLACSVALALSAFVCRADDVPAPSQKAEVIALATCAATKPCVTAAASHTPAATRQIPPVDISAETTRLPVAPSSARDLPDFEFRDNGDVVRRLADMRSLPVMTLWQTRRTQIYLGVNQKGLAGVHFRQRVPGELSTLWRSTVDAPRHVEVRAAPQIPRSLAP